MKNKGTIALSSLTIGVSAAALLGISDVSKAEDPAYCSLGEYCYLWYYPDLYDLQVIGYTNVPEQYRYYMTALVEGLYAYYSSGTELYGNCTMITPAGYQESFCGCEGYVSQHDITVYVDSWDTWHIVDVPVVSHIANIHDSQCWFP